MRTHLTIAAAATMAMLVAGPAFAQQARPDTRTMTCSQVQNTINQRGSVSMTTGNRSFGTFVANQRFCGGRLPPRAAATSVPTRDDNRCRVTHCVDDLRGP